MLRPNIVLNLSSFKKEIGKDIYLPALNHIMSITQKYAFLPGKI